ncbi:MAG: phage major capsid protein [Motilibacteraceae bacterium]
MTDTRALRDYLAEKRSVMLAAAAHIAEGRTAGEALSRSEEVSLEEYLSDVDRLDTRLDRLGAVTVTREEPVYRPDGDHSFFADMAATHRNADINARDRLVRHRKQVGEARAAGSSNLTGLVPPAFLTDLAPIARGSRGVANALRSLPLPEQGQEIVLPKATAGGTVSVQAAENDPLSTADPTSDLLPVPVMSVSGFVPASYALRMRSGGAADLAIATDLLDAYGEALSNKLVNGTGTGGQCTGLLNVSGAGSVTFTAATPDAKGFAAAIAQGAGTVGTTRKRWPSVVVMHPRRWAWYSGQSDTADRPILPPSSGVGATLAPEADAAEIVGMIGNLPVVLDESIPVNLGAGTDEDRVFVLRSNDLLLWEDGPFTAHVQQYQQTGASNLTFTYVLNKYAAFTADRRPEAVCVIGGTGLAATL